MKWGVFVYKKLELIWHNEQLEIVWQCQISFDDLKMMKRMKRSFAVKVSLSYANDDFIQPQLKLYIGIFFKITIPIFAQRYYWQVVVDAPTPELEAKVEHELKSLSLPMSKTKDQELQRFVTSVLVKEPTISWIHVHNAGSVLRFSVQPTPILEPPQTQKIEKYIAAKDGVIDRYELHVGQMVVKRGDTVKAAEDLVLDPTNSGAFAKVFAQYFLHITFQLPRSFHFVTQQGKQQQQLTDQHIDSLILPMVERKLLKELASETTLSLQKLLHVTFDNDKVNGEVLYLVNENIAIPSSNRARR